MKTRTRTKTKTKTPTKTKTVTKAPKPAEGSTLADFITKNFKPIIADWEEFARAHVPAARMMDLVQRRDHVAGMLKAIAIDLAKPQTKLQQVSKSKGQDDSSINSDTAANSHGTDRAATGFLPIDVVSEFRALRASVLRLWASKQTEFSREHLDELTRFNEAIDQLLAESLARYAKDVESSKDLFLGVLGHDLRNPLGAIMMSATLMMTQEGPDWRHSKTASRILNAGTRMEALIGDLVDFTRSRLGAGIRVDPAEMDMVNVCRQTVDEITAFHPRCIVTFQATGELTGSWDSGRIAQALSNLIGNAFQHGAEGAPIEVAVLGEADHVVLTVHNTGIQIPRENLHDIFSPFKQLAPHSERSRAAGSAGLGLYIVQAITTAHHGTIAVSSNKRGTTFTLRLPRALGASN